MSNYEHSNEFARLKNQTESIETNLSSYQYLAVLDELLYKSVYSLIEGTKFFDTFVAQILGWQTLNPKRKICGVGKASLASHLVTFFLVDSPAKKLVILKKIRFDRSVLLESIRQWLDTIEEYEKVSESAPSLEILEKLNSINEASLLRTGYGLHSVFTQVKYWYKQAVNFKEKILEKYTRLCLNTAQRDYVDLQGKVKLDDIIQVYLLTALKAIDRCDTEKGVLTTHIQNWLLSAKNVVVSKYISESQETNVNLVSLDEIDNMASEVPDNNHEEIDSVRTIAKLYDPEGFGRLALNIEEVLSAKDLQLIRSMVHSTK